MRYKLDQASTDNKSIVFRQRALAEWRTRLPAGVMLGSNEVERLFAEARANGKGIVDVSGIPEWPAAR